MTGVAFMASDPSRELMMMTVNGMIVKPDKQPLPDSYGDTAVCRVVSVERARGISILFSGSQGPVLEKVYLIVLGKLCVVVTISTIFRRAAGTIREGVIRRFRWNKR
jgi:hypothetical protein